LKEIEHGKDQIVLIGITCGMSAPYVAAQLDYAMSLPQYKCCVLLGFNPLELARNVSIEKWYNEEQKTFRSVAEALNLKPEHVILNPVIGPEPITGSTRMKGGTATKILLELIFSRAISQALSLPMVESQSSVYGILHEFENVNRETCILTSQMF
jgi:N-acetylmuramic acid 6-phosphate (MurNAc-6-P) etherase